MKLKWTYPFDKSDVRPCERIVAELWDQDSGKRLALILRSDNWPEGDYIITLMQPNKERPWELDPEEVEVQGDFLTAQAAALALATMTD